MSRETVRIHLIKPDGHEDHGVLTNDECQRAAKFKFAVDAARWTTYRAGLRRILGETLGISPAAVPITLTEHGKPVLAAPHDSLHFSLSHCNELALVAICPHGPVGIDLEPFSRAPELAGCESGFCHPDEIRDLPEEGEARWARMLEIWTAKEALLKALGTGFLHPPESIRLRIARTISIDGPESALPGIERLLLQHLDHPLLTGYQVALAAPVSHFQIVAPEESTSLLESGSMNPRFRKPNG